MPRTYLYTNPIPNSAMISHGLSWRHTVTKGNSSDQRSTGHDIRYKFTGKERDVETGFDYTSTVLSAGFGARYYDSDLSIWLSVDPLSDKYPSTSPYAYVEWNPVMFVDPNGMLKDIHITGEAAKQATEQLDASTSLKITRDSKTGKISATGKAKNDYDKMLLEAINNPDIDVRVEATNNPGDRVFGGAFMGTTVTNTDAENCKGSKKVISNQIVEPNALEYIDRVGGAEGSGKSMLHEVTESYLAAIISQDNGISAGRADKSSPTYWIYDAAHNNAAPQPPIYNYQRDNYVKNRAMVREIEKYLKQWPWPN